MLELHSVLVFGMCKFEFRRSVHVGGDLNPLKRGLDCACPNSALYVMELIGPLVINIFSNVIDGNAKLLKITPIQYSVKAKYDTQLADVCKNVIF